MNDSNLENALQKQHNETYYTALQLEYSNRAGVFLSPFEYKKLLEYKESIASVDNPYVKLIPLPAFNSKCLYYSNCNELNYLLDTYIEVAEYNLELSNKYSSSFKTSRIYSEIEGSLNVESVPTTRRRMKELLEENAASENVNDIIIKNMKAGIDFVENKPEFNSDNLFKLYSLLSDDCLSEESKLNPGDYYRYDTVEIAQYHGCPVDQIETNMNALFRFVEDTLEHHQFKELLLLPHICHYYILYIHPYFDFNGRCARMVSYWIYLLSGIESFVPIISEAINQTKPQYYKAIEHSRDAHNDLTYFFIYLLKISIDYILCYHNLSHLEMVAKNNGVILTETELNYLKKILISYQGPFNYSDFLKMAGISISKQGALKILNKFTSLGILKEASSSSKSKLFTLNKEVIPYMFKEFGFRQS